MSIKLLLLQTRVADDPMRDHERECFVRATGRPRENVVPFDLCDRAPTISETRRFDALTIWGSGNYYVTLGNLTDFTTLLETLREVVGIGHPTFVSCFGYQLPVHALGGEILHDPPRTEVGSYEIALTTEGRGDELFPFLPDQYWAQPGHKERASRYPDDITNLASGELSPF